MLNTDTEGTAWWIWSRCVGQSTILRANGISYPYGFDLSRLPVFNHVDETRIQISRLWGCSSTSVIVQLAIFPTICIIGNSICGYLLGQSLFKNKSLAFILGLTTGFSSQILLSTRTPLANNVLFLGLAPGLFATRWLQNRKR
jgi:hypothetical protein